MNPNDESDDEVISIKKALSFSTREEQLGYIDRKLYIYHVKNRIDLCNVSNCEFCNAFDELVMEVEAASKKYYPDKQ